MHFFSISKLNIKKYLFKYEHFKIIFKAVLKLNSLVLISLNLCNVHKDIPIKEEKYSKIRMCIPVLKHKWTVFLKLYNPI